MELCTFIDMLLLVHHVDQDYMVDGFAQEIYSHILSTYYFLCPPLIKEEGDKMCGKQDLW